MPDLVRCDGWTDWLTSAEMTSPLPFARTAERASRQYAGGVHGRRGRGSGGEVAALTATVATRDGE